MKTSKVFKIILVLVIICLFSCVPKKPISSKEEQKKQISQEFYEKAFTLEQQNELIEAQKNYQLSFAADPKNKKAELGIEKINNQLKSLSEQYYQKSIDLYKKGKYSQAKQYLLIALRHWPNHIKARQAIMASQNLNIEKYTWHTIKKGESLSMISKTFYGNFNQSGIIAEINNIDDAAFIQVGMKIKLPELKNHPFINKTAKGSLELLNDDTVQPENKTDPIIMYKNLAHDFFENQQFDNAVIEFKKVLNADPQDTESMAYISKAYYQMGSTAYTQKNLLAAIDHFQNALSYDKNCSPCTEKILESQSVYMESHYKAGMKHFDEQNLKMAIQEWTLVQTVDPEYKKVSKLLDKAKTIQKNIDAIKKAE